MGLFSRKDDRIEQKVAELEKIMSDTLADWLGQCNATAKTFIMEEIEALEDIRDGAKQAAYIDGLIDMAFKLQAITMNERATIADKVREIVKAKKALGDPVLKRRGVYEYRGYNILKIINDGDGGANWAIAKADSKEYVKSGLAFKEAVKEIDNLTK